MQKRVTREQPAIITKVKQLGFVVFEDKDFDLNIIGVRNMSSKEANLFDDEIHIIYKERGFWIDEYGPATTEPGKYYLAHKNYRKDGVAILKCPQQIRGGYILGAHGKTGYEALVQRRAPVTVIRDPDMDGELDYDGKEDTGYFGINIHRASLKGNGVTAAVDVWSAGCQVWQDVRDFQRMLELCYIQRERLGYETFTYTLIGI